MQRTTTAGADHAALRHVSGAGRPPPTPQQWSAVKELIRRLYVEDELPLREVRTYLELHHDFRASARMYKQRLQKWSFNKNLTKEDWEALAVLHTRRKALGKRSTLFFVRDRRKTVRDLQKYSRSQGVTEDALAARASANIEIPDYLRAATPENEDASPVTDSASDRSVKSYLSPKPSPSTEAYNTTPNLFAAFPANQGAFSSYPAETYPQRDLLFTPSNAHENRSPSSFGAYSYVSPISSGSASVAMTGSTMATSTHSEDLAIGRPSKTTSSWAFNPDISDPEIEPQLATSWSSDPISIPSSCENISRDFELMSHQLTDPVPLRSRYGNEDISSWMLLDPPEPGQDPNETVCLCEACHLPSASHFVSVHNSFQREPPRSILNDSDADKFGLPTTTKDEGAWMWIALCFAACLNMKKGKEDLSARSLSTASDELEKLILRSDPMLLTAANQMITILHQHSQGEIAVKITAAASASADRLLPSGNPVRTTFNYLAATADSSRSSETLAEVGITSDKLYQVYNTFDNDPRYGSQHPYTITASYNHAWLLRFEGRYQEAEARLQRIYATSCSIFGKNHMQSVTAVATLAGAQFGQQPQTPAKSEEAINNFKTAIRDCKPTLGKSHPYRLEAKRRLAMQYESMGQKEKMVPLYWEVLEGRVRMLGSRHHYTLGAREDYEKLMRGLGRWEGVVEGEVRALFQEKEQGKSESVGRRGSGSGSGSGEIIGRARRSASESSHESECLAF